MRSTLLWSVLLILFSGCTAVTEPAIAEATQSTGPGSYDPETAFQPSADNMADVDTVLERAASNDKLAMIVMGANWCHDSRGFVKTLNKSKLAEVLNEHYEIVFVDVGYLEEGREVINRFGMPVIYGTPTVLIVEPGSELLINRDDMHRWRDAARIDVNEAIEYFTAMAAPEASVKAAMALEPKPADLEALYEEIDAFERVQAERIYGGFEVLGPMLAMDRDERPEEFDRYWEQVRDLRYTITGDLTALRQEASDRVMAGEQDIVLTYPDYPPFDWE